MKRLFAILLILAASIAGGMQTSKQVTLAWDPMPTGEAWTEVRIYDISSTPAQLGTATCTPGPPITCPTQITITVTRKAYQFAATSYNGTWESAYSNVVILPGPPNPPGGLKKQ